MAEAFELGDQPTSVGLVVAAGQPVGTALSSPEIGLRYRPGKAQAARVTSVPSSRSETPVG